MKTTTTLQQLSSSLREGKSRRRPWRQTLNSKEDENCKIMSCYFYLCARQLLVNRLFKSKLSYLLSIWHCINIVCGHKTLCELPDGDVEREREVTIIILLPDVRYDGRLVWRSVASNKEWVKRNILPVPRLLLQGTTNVRHLKLFMFAKFICQNTDVHFHIYWIKCQSYFRTTILRVQETRRLTDRRRQTK
jgi:hypothetical protein